MLANTRLKRKELAIFWQQLSLMLNANISLSKSLFLLLKQHKKPSYRYLLQNLYHDLANGQEFNQALGKFPHYFPSFIRQLIQIGEHTGKLNLMLEKICIYLRNTQNLRQQWQQALSYPIFLLVTSILTIWSMLYWLVPQFTQIFANLSHPLPILTRMICKISSLVHCINPGFITILWLAILYLCRKAHNIGINNLTEKILYNLPGIKHITTKVHLIYFTSNLSLLLQAALPLTKALQLLPGLVKNTNIHPTIYLIYNDVNSGKSFNKSLAQFPCYPSLMVQMVSLGEEAGNLAEMLNKFAEIYTTELSSMLATISKLLEPLLIIFVGVLIGTVVIAMYLPIIQLGSSI